MSTRLGSRKEAEIVSASRRDVDGRVFYDIEVIPTAISCPPLYEARTGSLSIRSSRC